MKCFCVVMAVMFCTVFGTCQDKSGGNKNPTGRDGIQECRSNPDTLYNRQSVLERFAEMLNDAAPGYKELESRGFYVENERPRKFFIYDLADASNKGEPLGDCVKLVNDHVYHVAPIYSPYSFSHIVILEDGKLRVFKSINCKNSEDSLEDVVTYLNQKLKNDRNKNEIIGRVRNYRQYGVYFTIDDLSLHCEEICRSGKK